jgi:anti-sigma regulatory factor (Ser/Thr protein kinase)
VYQKKKLAGFPLSQAASPHDRLPGADADGRVEVAGRCVAAVGSGVGGNWHDAITLEDGRIGLVVGDVAGRGPDADAFMAELRGALRAYALESETPCDLASRLWRYVATLAPGRMATFLYAMFDPADDSLRFLSAAHPAPLVVSPGGRVTFVEGGTSAPLGGVTWARAGHDVTRLERGSTLVLYTDGLLERRAERAAVAARRLAALAAQATDGAPDALVGHLVDGMLEGRRPEDGAAILAMRAARLADDGLRLSVPAHPDRLTGVRRLVTRWLARHGAHAEEQQAITLALHEACANAIEHAYGPADAHFEVTAAHRDGRIELAVRDGGCWRAPRGEDRGRGLGLMDRLVDDVEVDSQADGTTVRLGHRLGGGGRSCRSR